jgi:hypothetical protein
VLICKKGGISCATWLYSYAVIFSEEEERQFVDIKLTENVESQTKG